jgi:predicted nucleic acid-binding protein
MATLLWIWETYVTSRGFQRQPKDYADSQIAALALANALTVVTRNQDDFPCVPTLNPFNRLVPSTA